MARAILEGRKTVTRRVVKFMQGKNPNWTGYVKDGLTLYNGTNEPCNMPAPYKVNDISVLNNIGFILHLLSISLDVISYNTDHQLFTSH